MWILLLLIFLTVVLALVPAVGLVAAIVPATLALAYGTWLLVGAVSGRTPSWALRRTHRERHFGPGGPDDPDRGR